MFTSLWLSNIKDHLRLFQFVAHPNSQQLLTSIWYEGLPSWRKRNQLIKFSMCIGLILILPFMAMYYWVFPHSRIGQLLRSPFMKFLYHSASFGVFLILLICSSIELTSIKDREKLRGPSPTELEWLICIWVMGKSAFFDIKSTLKHVYFSHIISQKRLFKTPNHRA